MDSSLPQDIKFITSALRTSGTGTGNLRRCTFPGAILTATSLDTRLNLVAYISSYANVGLEMQLLIITARSFIR